jgi:hypothetical protein
MSQFDQIINAIAMPIMMRIFGDAAIYESIDRSSVFESVDRYEITIELRKESDLVGQYGERLEPRTFGIVRLTEISNPEIGDRINIGLKWYRVDQILEKDAYTATLVLREIEEP